MNVLAHPRPMKRHREHVQQASLEVADRSGIGYVHLVLTHADGSMQRIVIENHVALELAIAVRNSTVEQ